MRCGCPRHPFGCCFSQLNSGLAAFSRQSRFQTILIGPESVCKPLAVAATQLCGAQPSPLAAAGTVHGSAGKILVFGSVAPSPGFANPPPESPISLQSTREGGVRVAPRRLLAVGIATGRSCDSRRNAAGSPNCN